MTPPLEAVTVGPVGVFFTNRNVDMALRAHSHAGAVFVTFTHPSGGIGWPSFADTNRWLGDVIRATLVAPITGTNEQVARMVWDEVDKVVASCAEPHLTPSVLRPWCHPGDRDTGGPSPRCLFALHRVDVAVTSQYDAIGHDQGTTTYTVGVAP